MIAFTLKLRSKLISITPSYCLGRHSVFGVRQFREARIGVTPRWIRKDSSRRFWLVETDGRHLQHAI